MDWGTQIVDAGGALHNVSAYAFDTLNQEKQNLIGDGHQILKSGATDDEILPE